MPNSYLDLSFDERVSFWKSGDLQRSGRVPILERDIIMVHLMELVSQSPIGQHLVLCGGTGGSKGHGLLDRYSEDLDYTYVASALEQGGFTKPLPSQWEIAGRRERICTKMRQSVTTDLYEPLREAFAPIGSISHPKFISGAYIMQMMANYKPAVPVRSDYLLAPVKIEIGCRNDAQPNTKVNVPCEVASIYPSLEFPEANIKILDPVALLWDKIDLCSLGVSDGRTGQYRRSRHWYDLYQLDLHGVVDRALGDISFGESWLAQMNQFEKNFMRDPLQAIAEPIRLLPQGQALKELERDYNRMVSEGMLYGNPPSFSQIVQTIKQIERKLEEAIR